MHHLSFLGQDTRKVCMFELLNVVPSKTKLLDLSKVLFSLEFGQGEFGQSYDMRLVDGH